LSNQALRFCSVEPRTGPISVTLTGRMPQNYRMFRFMTLWPACPYIHRLIRGGVSIEPSAFQNAFKKWTGKSPGEYRRQARRGLREAGGRL